MNKTVAAMITILFLFSCITVTKSVSANSADQNSWTELAPMHAARSYLGVVATNNKIYAIGGTDETYLSHTGMGNIGGIVGINEQYDPTTNTWTYKTPMPTPLAAFPIAVYQNKVYCFAKNLTEIYDPSTDTWESKTAPSPDLAGFTAYVVSGKIYFTGASGSSQNILYDPLTYSWFNKSAIPMMNTNYVTASVDKKIYCIGPSYSGSDGVNWVYDTQTDTWSKAKGYDQASYFYSTAVAISGVMAPKRIYTIGSSNGYNAIGGVASYNPETDSWSNAAGMPLKIEGAGHFFQ